MADPIGNFVPDYIKEMKDEDVRQVILELGTKITDRAKIKLGLQKLKKEDPEYWGLNVLVPTDDMARLCLLMGGKKIRVPMQFEELCAMVKENSNKFEKTDEAYVQEMLDTLSYNGVIEWNYENPDHKKQWVLPMYVPGSAEFANMNNKILEEHPEMGRFFERMSRLPLEGLTQMVPEGGAGIGMHVIPVEKAIEMENNSVSVEHISHWLDKYDGKYAASPCSCRRSRRTYEEGCADDPEGWCVAVGDMADYVVETDKGGHYITKEQALEIFRQAEENGFVHQITNIDGEDKIFAICNCNVNVCYALRTSQLFNTPNMSRSAYRAHVKTENCVACGRCVEHCPAGALKLGQKLCKKDGSQVQYPKQPLPTEVKWGEHMWEEDYRNKNRVETHASGTAPCKTACPAHIAVQGYLKLAAQGRYTDALALIKKNNPLPAICGHVCNKRCEQACTRGTIDEAIAIDEVKKFIAMHDLNAETRYIPKKVIPSLNPKFFEDTKIAIIGGGPAGISCAYYLAEKGYKPTIFEKNKKMGGMVTYGIPSYVLEKNIVEAEIDVLREMGVEFRNGVEVGKDVSIQELRDQGYKAFYLAIGCQGGHKVGVPGEDAEGVMTGVDFLHITTDDENYKLSGDTVVIGGGNVAIDVSRSALRCGSTKISQVSLETRDIMPALPEEIEVAESEGIEFFGGWGPKEILTENGKVTGIVFKKCTQVKDADGRFNPQYDENDTMTIPCSNVLLSVGQATIWGDLLKDEAVEFRGPAPVADKVTYQTTVKDIFVGGDMFTGPRFAIDAIAAGKEGAISIHRFVQPHSSLTIGRNQLVYNELNKDDIKVENYDNTGRQAPGRKSDAKVDFRDPVLTFTEEQVKKETARCLSCGASIVDLNRCIGCGICTTKCEFDAIHLERDLPGCSVMRRSEDKLKYVLPNGAKQAIKVAFKKKK